MKLAKFVLIVLGVYFQSSALYCKPDKCKCPENAKKCPENPCKNVKCQAFPDATCVPNYCNGCDADFIINGKTVDCRCLSVNCLIDPCKKASCPSYDPAAKCRPNYCGGCFADFYVGKTKVECEHCKKTVKCFADPCTVSPCRSQAPIDAHCVANYCYGCNADFYFGGKKHKCIHGCPHEDKDAKQLKNCHQCPDDKLCCIREGKILAMQPQYYLIET